MEGSVMAFPHLVRKSAPRGAALVASFLAVSVLTTLAIAISELSVTNSYTLTSSEDRLQALLLAQAGMNMAIARIKKLPDGPNALQTNWGPHQFIRVDKTTGGGFIILTAYGSVENKLSAGNVTRVERRLEAVLKPSSQQGAFRAGAFGDATLDAGGNINTDSYDSRGIPIVKADGTPELDGAGQPMYTPATYNQQVKATARLKTRPNTLADPITATEMGAPDGAYTAAELADFRTTSVGSNGDVGSNGSISAVGALVINGDATPGPGQTVSGGGTITGSTSSALVPMSLDIPYYTPPAGLAVTAVPSTISAGTYRFASWPSADYTVTGDVTVYLDGDMIQNGGKVITLAPGASLTIWQGAGSFTLNGGGIINGAPSRNPKEFTLITSTVDTVKLAGGAQFYGTVYAPLAHVDVEGNAASFGAVLGKTVDLTGTADFHYDVNARSPAIIESITLVTYRELE
jgi:hypothetical protein